MRIRTAESVSPMHPDKICDRISDALLDAYLKQDPLSRVAVETMGGHGIVTVTGEVTSKANINIRDIVKKIISDKYGIQINLVKQSPEISQGVETGGAGDQGIMLGYACDETSEMMPLETILSRNLCQFIYQRHAFDGKTQITMKDNKIFSIVTSFQNIKQQDLLKLINKWLENKNLKAEKIYCNPAGDWNQGGFEADTGLTGRKLIIDNYGPRIPIGGGAFSGKDPTKVDRSAAYMARKIAVDYLKKRKAKQVFCYLAYAIGIAEPLQATVIIDGQEEEVQGYNLTPLGIIKYLDLRKPQFEETAQFGHFGNNFKWDN